VLVFAVPHSSALKGEASPVEPLLAIASPVLELADGTQPVTAVSWSSDEVHEWIAAGRVDGSVAFYSLTSKGQTSPNQTRLVVPEFVVTTNNGYCIRTLSFSPEDPGLLAIAGHFDLVELWDLSEPLKCIASYKPPGAWVREISWPYGHRGIYYVCEDLGIRHIHLELQRKMPNNMMVVQSGAEATDVAVSVDASSWHGQFFSFLFLPRQRSLC
jgi:WD40 repeat protein